MTRGEQDRSAPSSAGPADLPRIPRRRSESHKGDYGRVLLIGGSRGMSGAVVLAGTAALRSGAGLVTLAVPRSIQDVVAGFEPSYMTLGLEETADGTFAESALVGLSPSMDRAEAVAIGPGLGRGDGLARIVAELYTKCGQPMVVDADGLYALGCQAERLASHAGPRILTPHLGEFRRLLGGARLTLKEASEKAHEVARVWDVVLVLKQHRTLVTNGDARWINSSGNPGMATGGCGDVLTGAIAALLGQGFSAWDAARMAVYAHGAAGDGAADQWGQTGMTARDVVACLPCAWQALEGP